MGLGEAEVATPESLDLTDGESPISLIAVGDMKETTFGSHDKIVSKEKLLCQSMTLTVPTDYHCKCLVRHLGFTFHIVSCCSIIL